MMYLITYDLNKAGQNYNALYEQIQTAPKWIHLMESVWLIYTNESVALWQQKLKKVMDDNDNLFIVNITKQTQNGWLPQNKWDWINKNNV